MSDTDSISNRRTATVEVFTINGAKFDVECVGYVVESGILRFYLMGDLGRKYTYSFPLTSVLFFKEPE